MNTNFELWLAEIKKKVKSNFCLAPLDTSNAIIGGFPQLTATYAESIPMSLHHHLTHLPLVQHICVSESGQQWFRWWLVIYSGPSHYLNQCWVIVNWTLRNNSDDQFWVLHINRTVTWRIIVIFVILPFIMLNSWLKWPPWVIPSLEGLLYIWVYVKCVPGDNCALVFLSEWHVALL